jgi:hypothetical protein
MILDFLARAFSVPLWPTSQMGLRDSFTPKTTDTIRCSPSDNFRVDHNPQVHLEPPVSLVCCILRRNILLTTFFVS